MTLGQNWGGLILQFSQAHTVKEIKKLHAAVQQQDAVDYRRPILNSSYRVSTNLTKQISRRFPGEISRKIQDMFELLRPAMQCTESTSLPKYRTKTWYAQHGTVAKISDPVSSFIMSGSQCGWSSTFYTKISRRIIQIQEFQDFQEGF